MKIEFGERIAAQGVLTVGCAGIVFDTARKKVLLTQREDNALWCVPGGHMEPGESAAECAEREVWEETGVRVRAARLIGVYSDPHMLVTYGDGNRKQFVSLCFECEAVSGTPGLSNETLAVGWFTETEALALDLLPHHRRRVVDAFAGRVEAVIA